MTDSNSFSKFWKKWDNHFEFKRKDGHVSFNSMTGYQWEVFKQEFAELCEQQAKKAEKERKKKHTTYFKMIMQGEINAFRLVKPQLLTTTKTVKISNSKKGLRAVSGQPQLTDTSMSNRKCAQPVGAKPTNPKHKHN